jgi:hypothetical protein
MVTRNQAFAKQEHGLSLHIRVNRNVALISLRPCRGAGLNRAITHGIARDGRELKPPMAYGFYAGLKPADLADIIAYLRTVPPLQ